MLSTDVRPIEALVDLTWLVHNFKISKGAFLSDSSTQRDNKTMIKVNFDTISVEWLNKL